MIEQRAILELIEKGGISMWPLLFLSILSLSTILERLAFWLGVVAKERELIDRVLEAARYDWQVVQEIAKQGSRKPIGRFLYAPLRLPNPKPELFRLALESAADNELAAMRRGEKILETVIALSPLLGLLGTVVGLINSLGSIRLGDIGTNATRDVTTGIGEALISTAAGLIVAIMTLVFYRIFQGFLVSQMKMFTKSGNELELLYRQFWAEAEKNPELLSRSSRLVEQKTDSDTGNSTESLSGESGRLSEDSNSASSESLSGESGRLSEDSDSASSGFLSSDNSQTSEGESLVPQRSLAGEISEGSSEPTTTNVENPAQMEQQPEATGHVESSTKTEE